MQLEWRLQVEFVASKNRKFMENLIKQNHEKTSPEWCDLFK
jgi:hypothetical protein